MNTPPPVELKSFELREKALRDIKAIHTRWYRGDMTADEAVREMEAIAVGVWMKEESISPKPTKDGETPRYKELLDYLHVQFPATIGNFFIEKLIKELERELNSAKQQILMDTECIERIRTAGEKAEAKLNDMKGEVGLAWKEGATQAVGNIALDFPKTAKELYDSSRAKRVVEGTL